MTEVEITVGLLGLIAIIGATACISFIIGFKAGKKYEAGFYFDRDRMVED
jgi:hypothetical protein